MQLIIDGTPAEVKEFLQKTADLHPEVIAECVEASATETVEEVEPEAFSVIMKSLKGNEAHFLPRSQEDAETAKAISLDILQHKEIPSDEYTRGINTRIVNYLKKLAEDPNSEVQMLDNTESHFPHLFYVNLDHTH